MSPKTRKAPAPPVEAPSELDPSTTPPGEIGSKDDFRASEEAQQPAPVETALPTLAEAKADIEQGDFKGLSAAAEKAREKADAAKLDVSQVRTAGGWAAGVSPTGQRTYTSPADGISPSGVPQINSPAAGVGVGARPDDPTTAPEDTQPVRYDHAPFVQPNPDPPPPKPKLNPEQRIASKAAATKLGYTFVDNPDGTVNAFKRDDLTVREHHGADEAEVLARIDAWENMQVRRVAS